MGVRSISRESIGPHDPIARLASYPLSFDPHLASLSVPNQRKIMKAVTPAAGFGTRMLPATKVVPKGNARGRRQASDSIYC